MLRLNRYAVPPAIALILTVVVANWLVANVQPIPVGFGQHAPAGVLAAGLAFTLRDVLHEAAGRAVVLAAILGGAVASLLVGLANDPVPGLPSVERIAIAGAIAYLVSELADLLAYEPMRRRGWIRAVTVSGIVGLIVDSLLFLWLAFGNLDFFAGQVLGKTYVLAATVALIAPLLPHRRRVEA